MDNQEAIGFLKNMIGRESIGFVCLEREGDVAIWQYHVEALQMAISALDKQIPKETVEPASLYFRYACPTCGNYPLSGHYCSECGQAIVYNKEGEGCTAMSLMRRIGVAISEHGQSN